MPAFAGYDLEFAELKVDNLDWLELKVTDLEYGCKGAYINPIANIEKCSEDIAQNDESKKPTKSEKGLDGARDAMVPQVAVSLPPKRSWLDRQFEYVDTGLVIGIAHSLWPMIALTLCQALLATICLMFCGHLSTTELAGVALALTVLSITGFSFAEGLTSASQTHFSQTFGTGQISRMDMYLIKSLLVLPFFLLPCVAIHVNIEYILSWAGQRPEVARIAGRFLLICIPALLVSQLHYIFMDYLTCQNIRLMAAISSFCGFLTATLFNYVLVYRVELRTEGSAAALAIAACVMLLIDITYVFITKRRQWAGWSAEVFLDWLPMIGIALAGILMMCLEWWALEIAIVITSFLGEIELASLSVVLNLHIITTIIPISFSMGVSILVGQHLGAGEVRKMKTIVKLAYCSIALVQLVFCLVLFCSRYHLPLLFTTDPCVITKVGDILSIHVISVFFNGLMNVSVGVMRGSGRQAVASLVIFVGLYVIGLPLGALLMFLTSLGVRGIVTGVAVGVVFEVVVIVIIIIRTDWHNQSRLARKRVKAEMEKEESRRNSLAVPLQGEAPLAKPESVESLKLPVPSLMSFSLLAKRGALLASLTGILLLGVLLRLLVLVPEQELCSGDPVFNGTASVAYGVSYCPELANNSLALGADHQIINDLKNCV